MKTPTIILIGPSPTLIGGVATHMRNLLRGELREEFNIIFLEASSRDPSEPLWNRVWRVLGSSLTLYRLLRQYPDAVLHLNPSMDTKSLLRDSFLAVVGKLCGAKLLIQFHGGRLHKVKWVTRPPFKQFLYSILKKADLIILLSQEQVESLELVYGARYRQLRIQRLPALFLDVSIPNMDQKAKDNAAVRFLFLGRVIKEKGIFEILEAFDVVREEIPKVSLTIAGTGPDLEAVQRLCEQKGSLRDVEFLGFVTGEQKIKVLHQSDVFLLPTTWAEGLPYALLEAMASGLSIIASPSGAIVEVLQNSVHGFLVPAKDSAALAEKMLTLARDPALRGKMGEASRASVRKHFSLERQREVFGEIYWQLLGQTTEVSTCGLPQSHDRL